MYTPLTLHIVGVAPLIMHNGQLADPLNKFSKMKKEISTRRNKTDADLEEIFRISFMGSLYADEEGDIVLPSHMIEAVILGGAKKSKLGKIASAAVVVENNAKLIYDGPRDHGELFNDERFRLSALVGIGQAHVPSVRPIFRKWSADLAISYLPDLLDKNTLVAAVRNAGIYCGFGDWRPRFGRFEIQE